MKRLYKKLPNERRRKVSGIIGHVALGMTAAAFIAFIVALPILSAIGMIKFLF
ncbi:MAG: hypothetical protein OSJ83_03830 [Clostridia bacterium]|nr:hypothetical protein [Clostridia bacterium]